METPYNIVPYKGHAIELHNDNDTEHAYRDLAAGADGLILVLEGGRDYNSFGYDRAYAYIQEKLSAAPVMDIYLKMPKETQAEMEARAKRYDSTIADYWRDCGVRDYLEALEYSYNERGYERLTTLCAALNIATHEFTVRGYSQGDYAKLLLIDNGEFTDFEAGAKAHEDYVERAFFTGFIGYVVPSINESCWQYSDEKTATEDAKAVIDAHIESEERKREQRTKVFIKHHVPLEKRA